MAINPVASKPVSNNAGGIPQLTKAAKDFLTGIDWTAEKLPKQLTSIDTADTNPERMKQIAKLPKGVQEAFNFYFKHVENEDWGSVSAYKLNLNGQQMYAIRTGTDGDDGYIEVFNFAGKRIATGLEGLKDDGKGGFVPTTTWDAKLGAVRTKATEND
ncbi:MAG TPA: hypothetical protein VGK67_21865 [Myxococcales bacterium]|jgi:hypothetical protein